jgi:hypothetical protein
MSAYPSRYKLILTYDIITEDQDVYFQFMLGEFVPMAQSLGVHMNGAWHTAYGPYPMRLVEFIANDLGTMQAALDHHLWQRMEDRLQHFVANYHRKVVRLREDVFQF